MLHIVSDFRSRDWADAQGELHPGVMEALARFTEHGEIRFIDILNAIDAFPAEGRCAFGWGACDESHPCPLHGAWSRLNHSLRDWASDTNLAEIASAATDDQLLALLPKSD